MDILKKSISPLKEKSSLKDLRIADLALFISTAHLKNLGKAAFLHHLSQSSASAAICRVEKVFGKSLCTHEKRQFRLTKEGEELLPKAEVWLKDLKEKVAILENTPIRLATTHAIARVSISKEILKENLELKLMRPDQAYGSILRDEADLALVLNNSNWKGVLAKEVGLGHFQLFSKKSKIPEQPILLPEDQIEVLALTQRWQQVYKRPLPVKARIPSWSLIADICKESTEVGFLPDFLANPLHLHPVSWQPKPSSYKILALYRNTNSQTFQKRIEGFIELLQPLFNKNL